jgi:hypothetical protein
MMIREGCFYLVQTKPSRDVMAFDFPPLFLLLYITPEFLNVLPVVAQVSSFFLCCLLCVELKKTFWLSHDFDALLSCKYNRSIGIVHMLL